MVLERDYSNLLYCTADTHIVNRNESNNMPLAKNKHKDKQDKDFVITELSHDELDLQIQFNRVMYVLKRAIEKIKIVAYLPDLIASDGKLLRQFFDDETVQFVLDICEKDQSMAETIGQRAILLRKRDDSPILRNTKMDQAMLELIAILYNNKMIKKEIIEGDVVFGEGAQKLIDTLNLLYSACDQKIKMSAKQEKARQHELRKAWRDNLIVKKEVQSLSKKLNNQREMFSTEINSKIKITEEYEDKVTILKANFKEKINKRVGESEKLMGLEAAASEMKIAELTAETKTVQLEYQTLLENHISYEKGLRAKRIKVEAQLATWLVKYDQDIGERHYEIEALTKEYEEQKAEMDAIQELFDEQEDEYEELMEEKEAEDRRIYEIKMYKILANIAARRIQRAWKAYWQRKQARIRARKARARERRAGAGKGRKGKKKGKIVESKIHDGDMLDDLSKMFSGDLLDDITTPAFDNTPINVEL